jgi:3-deoxy-7-phosphoheptulonate synthase
MPNTYLTDNVRIKTVKPLIQPAILIEDQPAPSEVLDLTKRAREEITASLTGQNDRLVCVVGPCSIHDVEAAEDYAARLKKASTKYEDDLIVIMRTYFEKPRTVGGWKGLVYDPELDGSHKINQGLKAARELLINIGRLGIPSGTEMLDNILPQFISDLVAWTAIGARTVESQIHRQVASGSSMPIGFKNSTSGQVGPAVDAVRAAAVSHWFPGVTKQGVTAIFQTEGNKACHVILRGGTETGPNFSEADVHQTCEQLRTHGLDPRVMVDCSHGNSGKDYRKQAAVAEEISRQIAGGSDEIFGVMIESNIKEGRQDSSDLNSLEYGKSITDSCISIDETEDVLGNLAESVQQRRKG